MGRGQALTPSPPLNTTHSCRFRTLAPGPQWPGGGVGGSFPKLGYKGLAPVTIAATTPHLLLPQPRAVEKATWCLGEVPSSGGEGAHAAVYSVPELLGAHPPPPDGVGHPRAASSEETRSGEASGTRPEASAALRPGCTA